MSYTLSQRTKNALSRELVEPNIILCIDGIDSCFAIKINKVEFRFDDGQFFDSGLFFDGLVNDSSTLDLISLTGTTTTITQQLEPDKGAASSTQNVTVTLIDRNNIVSEIISPGFIVDEIIYRNCRLYLGMQESSFPEDYIEIFNGKIQEVRAGVGTIDLLITHPEDLKKSQIFERAETTLTQDALYDSAIIQDLKYIKRPDVIGNVEIEYISAALGDDAIVTVTGNSIEVQVDTAFTKAKTVKKRIENDADANQLVTVQIYDDPENIQTTQTPTTLGSSDEIFVDSVNGFLLPTGDDLFTTYLRINDEIMFYDGIDTVANKFTGVVRASLTSFGFNHESGDQVQSFYVLGDAGPTFGNAIDLALKVMISGSPLLYFEGSATDFNFVPGVGTLVNSIYLPGSFIKRDYGATVGDTFEITGSTSNDATGQVITSIIEIGSGTYIFCSGTAINTELNATATIKIQSKYNVLPDGVGMLPRQIDIDRFDFIKTTYASAIGNYQFYLKDTVTSKEFINTQIFLPSALYSLPRKGKVSLGIISPPLYDENTQVLDLSNVKNPKAIKINRSVNKNFYNTVIYQYNPDSVEEKFLNKNITISADSKNRIDAPSKVFQLKAEGLRAGGTTTEILSRNARRFLDRYKYGAEGLKLDVLFKTGFGVEIGDAIIFGDPNFYLTDTSKGNKEMSPKIYEVVNKELNWKSGQISLTLLDSNYSSELRFGVFSPSTIVASGSSTTQISIQDSYGTISPSKEKDKWANYIGKEILVHSEDWSVEGLTYLQGFDSGNDYKMLVSPALAFTPGAGYIIDIPYYDDIDPQETFYKNVHVFWDPHIEVVSGTSETEFEVASGDGAKFFVGCRIRVHNFDFTVDSGEDGVKVTDVTGDVITCEALGFTPDSTSLVDLIGFVYDEGKPYSWL